MNETHVIVKVAFALLAASFTLASGLLFQFGHFI